MPLYFVTCVLIFWIPGGALAAGNWRSLSRAERRGFWWVCAVMAVVTFGMEYVYLWADIWSFLEAHDPLLGIEFGGAPIEEFTFWFGATPFVLGVYWTARRIIRRGRRRRRRRPRRRNRRG